MKRICIIILIFIAIMVSFSNEIDYIKEYNLCFDLKDNSLKDKLYQLTSTQFYINYTNARYLMYTNIYKDNDITQCVYSSFSIENLDEIPNPSYMNCEHLWPQSKFSNLDSNLQKVDLHHLRPCKSRINSIRGNNPIGEVTYIEKKLDGSLYGRTSYGEIVFEPKDSSKGNIARSLFYFSIRYKISIDDKYEIIYRRWSKQFPVIELEYYRNCLVHEFQGNRNPFIDHPEFIDLISDF